MKKFLMIYLSGALCLLVSKNLEAQSGWQSMYKSNTNASLIPPSPTAASFQRYGITPVILSSGMANISIPIYDVKAGDISMPISLSYHYNGLKPKEEAGWVGTGWNLNVGGVITRIQRGSIDNTRPAGRNYDDINVLDSVTNTVNFRHKFFLDYTFFNQYYDTEPDIYTYNFLGHQGKFMFIKGKAYFPSYENLKIFKLPSDEGFYITDDNGTQYQFKAIESTRSKTNPDPLLPSTGWASSWHLTKIISANQVNWIEFYYKDYLYTESQSAYSQKHKISFAELVSDVTCAGAVGCFQTNTNNQPGNYISGKSLDSIQTSDGQKIKLKQLSTARTDIVSTENALNQVIVYGQKGFTTDTVIKKIGFDYGYFSNASFPSAAAYLRLKLKNVYTLNNVNDTLSSYGFEYENETSNFPQKNSFNIDHWGYFNDVDETIITNSSTLLPTVFFHNRDGNLSSTSNNAANREPDYNFCKYGILKKITYPTGGSTKFTYGQNKYYSDYNETVDYFKDTSISQTSFYYTNAQHISRLYGSFTIDESKTVYISVGRTLWDSLSLPLKNFKTILSIRKYISGECDAIPPTCIFDTVYKSPLLYETNERVDSVTLSPGVYQYTLSCEDNSFNTKMAINYKIRLAANSAFEGADGPGLRIQKTEDYDGVNSTPSLTKSYVYRDSADIPSGIINEAPRYGVFCSEEESMCQRTLPCSTVPYLVYSITSDQNSLYNANLNFSYYYTAVKEYTGTSSNSKFYSEHYFRPVVKGEPTHKVVVYADGFILSEGSWISDLVKGVFEDLVFAEPDEYFSRNWKNKNGVYLKSNEVKTNYEYVLDTSFVGIKPKPVTDENNEAPDVYYTGWVYNKNTVYCLWKYPTQKVETVYDDAGTKLVNTTNYVYDKTLRYLRSTEEMMSDGKIITTRHKYPQDYQDNSNAIALYNKRMLSPAIETQVWQKNGSDSSMLKGVINDFNTTVLKPAKKYFLFSDKPVAVLNNEGLLPPGQNDVDRPLYTNTISDSRYSEKFRYTYDKSGNVIEETQDSNMNRIVSYIWGYHYLYPVAKIEGASFATALTKVDTAALQTITSDATMRSTLAALRTITGAMVTIYTYKPFVGLSSVTDLNGKTTSYEYDNFYRLQDIKDFNGFILKAYEYNFFKQPASGGTTPPPDITVNSNNPLGVTGFSVTYTNVSTSTTYTFPISAGGGTLGTVPAGMYNIVISKPGNALSVSFYAGCTLTITGTSATFNNVSINSGGCNSVTIDPS